jgi:hypothetical protein
VESTANYKLLRAYTSKLLALTWRFATMAVIGQNGTDHFVHEYTHKAQSDVLVAVGLPDGRLTSLASAEACTMMSLQQAKFIKQKGKGIEAYSLGHNRWDRSGVFADALKLPTSRPLFASEMKLMPEQLGQHGEGTVAPGMHGLPPSTIGQRWHDLIRQGLDPHGMTRVQYTLQDLTIRIGSNASINFDTATQVLQEILQKALDSEAVNVNLGLKSFLSRFFRQGAASTNVFVHSPAKDYVPPSELRSPDKTGEKKQKTDKFMNQIAEGFAKEDGVDANFEHTAGHALRVKLSAKLAQTPKTAKTPKPIKMDDATTGKEALTPHEFMALLHGDELQNWVRESRNRWGKLRTIRGLLAYFGQDHVNGKQSLNSIVFCGGVTMASIMGRWRAVTKEGRKDKTKLRRTNSTAVAKALQNALTVQKGEQNSTKFIGHGKAADIDDEARLLDAMVLTEQLYETRVCSTERLMSWFVLFHAMAEPSSRLPVLCYDLGKSESRLRVASTPAPVPNHGDPEEDHDCVDAPQEEDSEAVVFI